MTDRLLFLENPSPINQSKLWLHEHLEWFQWLKSRIQQPTKFEYANDERLGKLLYLDDNAPCTPSHLPNKRHKAQHLQQSRDKSVWPFLHLIKYAKTHHELAGLR